MKTISHGTYLFNVNILLPWTCYSMESSMRDVRRWTLDVQFWIAAR